MAGLGLELGLGLALALALGLGLGLGLEGQRAIPRCGGHPTTLACRLSSGMLARRGEIVAAPSLGHHAAAPREAVEAHTPLLLVHAVSVSMLRRHLGGGRGPFGG